MKRVIFRVAKVQDRLTYANRNERLQEQIAAAVSASGTVKLPKDNEIILETFGCSLGYSCM